MENKEKVAGNINSFLDHIRSKGRYSFGLLEFKSKLGLNDKSANQSLHRAILKKKIARVRKGFYVILTPEYTQQGMIPISLFINDMMKELGKPYYIGLVSAAALYGASNQQPMQTYVITKQPALRPIKSNVIRITFLIKKDWSTQSIIQKKSDAGFFNISSPELTLLDLFYYTHIIPLHYSLGMTEDLLEAVTPAALKKTAKVYPYRSVIQRVGYVLDKILSNKQMSDILKDVLKKEKLYPVLLNAEKKKEGAIDEKWMIIENTKIEL